MLKINEQGWAAVLSDEMQQPYFKELCAFVEAEYEAKTVFPPYS